MPFRHPDRSDALDARIATEIRERLEEAIDFVCLEALVNQRRATGRPAPVADNAADRAEYQAHVAGFLRMLGDELRGGGEATPASEAHTVLLDAQVRLARQLPDYWQRFEAVSARYLAEPVSGRERRGVLARLFGRG
ncbi:MAG TPA: hypothetical protein VHZ49_06340 [Methylomirabilota bacterium]|nr:hypothetical protein [Methylomirabilota bacterium]